jgi:hypothetical protein
LSTKIVSTDVSFYWDPTHIPLSHAESDLFNLADRCVVLSGKDDQVDIDLAHTLARRIYQIAATTPGSPSHKIHYVAQRLVGALYDDLSRRTIRDNPDLSNHLGRLSREQLLQSHLFMGTHLLFGQQVQNFCYNSRTTPDYPITSIQERYGPQILQEWTGMFHLPIEVLERVFDQIAGCCYGISIDFIRLYFQERGSGKTLFQATQTAGGSFTNGATELAELLQLTMHAAVTHGGCPNLLELTLQKMGLNIGSPYDQSMSLWQDGAYLIAFQPQGSEHGHLIALIFEEEDAVIHDPNYGTLTFSKTQAIDFVHQTRQKFSKNNTSQIYLGADQILPTVNLKDNRVRIRGYTQTEAIVWV